MAMLVGHAVRRAERTAAPVVVVGSVKARQAPHSSASAVLQQTNKENSQCLTGGY
jgi:hypothetical protein